MFSLIVISRKSNPELINYLKNLCDLDFLEIILVIDNNDFSYKNSDIKVIKSDKNSIPLKRNLGIRYAKNDYIIFNDSDIRANLNYFFKIKELVKKNINLEIFGGPNIHKNNTNFIYKAISSCYKCYATSGLNNIYHKNNSFKTMNVNFLPTCNLIIKKSVFDKIGYFDEKLITGEDIEFSRRSIKAGISIVFISHLKVTHITKDLKNFIYERINYGNSIRDYIDNSDFIMIAKSVIVLLFSSVILALGIKTFSYFGFYTITALTACLSSLYLDSLINTKKFNVLIPLMNLIGLFSMSLGIVLGLVKKRRYYNYKNISDN